MNFLPNKLICPCSEMYLDPLLEGGENAVKQPIRDCKHSADEDCSANCTYFKFTANGYNSGGTDTK